MSLTPGMIGPNIPCTGIPRSANNLMVLNLLAMVKPLVPLLCGYDLEPQ
ncbi:MAG: hypothetical protein IPN15_12660 [Saprospiraceae bacterium]|nr:hypothetical protein [Candidatus Vicinibacter affinis]